MDPIIKNSKVVPFEVRFHHSLGEEESEVLRDIFTPNSIELKQSCNGVLKVGLI